MKLNKHCCVPPGPVNLSHAENRFRKRHRGLGGSDSPWGIPAHAAGQIVGRQIRGAIPCRQDSGWGLFGPRPGGFERFHWCFPSKKRHFRASDTRCSRASGVWGNDSRRHPDLHGVGIGSNAWPGWKRSQGATSRWVSADDQPPWCHDFRGEWRIAGQEV